MISMKYDDNLKLLREEKGLKQEEIAKVLGISRSTYKDYELRISFVPVKYLNTLSNFYNVSVDYLLGISNNRVYDSSKANIDKISAGIRLKEFRKSRNLTQKKLASVLNVTFSSIAFNEKGRNLIGTQFLYTICDKYNVSADYLLGKIDYNPLEVNNE